MFVNAQVQQGYYSGVLDIPGGSKLCVYAYCVIALTEQHCSWKKRKKTCSCRFSSINLSTKYAAGWTVAGVGGGRGPALGQTQELLSREFQPSPALGAFSEAMRLCGVPGEQTPQLALKEHQRVQEQPSSTIQQGQQQKPVKNFCCQRKNSKCWLVSERVCSLPAQSSQRCVSDPGQPWSTLLSCGEWGWS